MARLLKLDKAQKTQNPTATETVKTTKKDNKKDSTNQKHRVPFLKSLKGKIELMFLFSIIFTVVVLLLISVPVSQRNMEKTIENYMQDEAASNGKLIDLEAYRIGPEKVLNHAFLDPLMADVGVKGMKSSSAFLINLDGKIQWHQDLTMLGKNVNKTNAALASLTQKLQAGETVENGVTTFTSNGKEIYCSYYISTKSPSPFVYVIQVNKDEVLASVTNMARELMIAGAGIAILVTLFGMVFMKKSLSPVDDMRHYIRRMGELDLRKDEIVEKLGKRKDEFGRMARSIMFLQERLSATIANIQGQSEKLFSSSDAMMKNAENMSETSGQVDQAVSDIASGASSQAESTRETSENITEMGQLIEQTNGRVQALSDASQSMMEAQNTAHEILTDLDRINSETMEAVSAIAEQTQKTNESASHIREVTKLIADIASQTNLLSLNASIEAARAGEAGRGFAVVAEEIGKLAEQSNASAKQIEEIIRELVADSEESVRTMEYVREITGRQSEDIGRTGDAFKKIGEGIDAANLSVDAIATSVAQMDEARNRVVDSVTSLQAIATQNAASTQQSSASVTEINQIAGSIRDSSGTLRDIAESLKDDMSQFQA